MNITYRPKNIVPVRDYLGVQPRFKHLFKPEYEYLIKEWQDRVDAKWSIYKEEKQLEFNLLSINL